MQFADCGPLSSLKKVINPIVLGVHGVYDIFFSVFAFCPAVTVVRLGPSLLLRSCFMIVPFCSLCKTRFTLVYTRDLSFLVNIYQSPTAEFQIFVISTLNVQDNHILILNLPVNVQWNFVSKSQYLHLLLSLISGCCQCIILEFICFIFAVSHCGIPALQ
jgi:hypothetical protein